MPNSAKDLKALHSLQLERFRHVAEYEEDQRGRELEALKFQVGDQWPEDAKIARQGLPAANGQTAVPARPMLVMRTLDQPLAQVANQERNADLAVTIVAKDGEANQKTADVYGGLVRAIQVDSHADDVYSWAFQRMSACGRGYARLNKAYANEQTGFEQVLRVEPIKNGFSVYLDPIRKWHPDGGFWEPEYGFVTEDIPEKRYIELFGDSKLAQASDGDELAGLGDQRKLWCTENEAGKTYRVAEVFYATYAKKTLRDGDQSREVLTRTIWWGKMNGCEWLDEPQEWDGHFIPLFENSGYVYDVGGKVVIEGMIQPAISPCRMVNYTVTAAMEKMGTAALSPWIGIAGQFQGYEAWWDQANVRNFSKLEYNALTSATGNQLLPPPQRNNDEPAIQAYNEMAGTFINFVRSTTGVTDAALGHVNPNDRSGKAIEELKQASEIGTSGYLDRHKTFVRHIGVAMVDMIPFVYDTPGRIERILNAEGDESRVMLNAPFTRDESGEPQPVPQPSFLQRGMQAIGMSRAPQVEHYDLAKGKYGVLVEVGKSQQTQEAETLAGMNALAQAAPELVPRYADLWVKSMPLKNRDQIAARVKPPGVDDPQMPPEAQAMVQQLQAQIADLQEKADDNQTKLIIAQSSDETKKQIAGIQAETQVAVAEIKAGMDQVKNQISVLAQLVKLDHETRMAQQDAFDQKQAQQADHEHTGAHTALEHAHELDMAEQQRQHDQMTQAREHAHQGRMAVTPPPKDPNKVTKPNGADRG